MLKTYVTLKNGHGTDVQLYLMMMIRTSSKFKKKFCLIKVLCAQHLYLFFKENSNRQFQDIWCTALLQSKLVYNLVKYDVKKCKQTYVKSDFFIYYIFISTVPIRRHLTPE